MSRDDQLWAQERELKLELARLEQLRSAKAQADPASEVIVAGLTIEITRLTRNLEACQRELAERDCPQRSA